eukprot:3763540-Pyramimonas_sp.AAC.1
MEALEMTEREYAVANAVVDHHAKMALSVHPSADPLFLQSVSLAEERVDHFVKLASLVLPLFEASP